MRVRPLFRRTRSEARPGPDRHACHAPQGRTAANTFLPAMRYSGTGINFSSRPPVPSSSSHSAPSGPCSTSRMRWPMA